MRILVTGSRDWEDYDVIRGALAAALPVDYAGTVPVLVHGGARGADQMAAHVSLTWGWKQEEHRAGWGRLGKAAGPVRNREMVLAGADLCLAFIRNGSPGATGCAAMAQQHGIPVRRYLA